MFKRRATKKGSVANKEINSDLQFKVTEAYKAVRTNIVFSLLKENCKKIVISSSVSGEGKTTSAVHIAISLGQMDKKVLLIDADLRKPRINQFFEIDNTPGLTNYLGGMADYGKILHVTNYKNLSVITAGILVPNPSELLASDKMSSFLQELESQFDYIVIDTPPLNVVVDAMPLIKLSDGVILIIKEGASTYPELNKTIKSLEMVDAKILGFVMNATQAKAKRSYKHGYGGYGYEYGSHSRKAADKVPD